MTRMSVSGIAKQVVTGLARGDANVISHFCEDFIEHHDGASSAAALATRLAATLTDHPKADSRMNAGCQATFVLWTIAGRLTTHGH